MKKIAISLLFLLFLGSLSAQDILHMRSGKDIKGWVKDLREKTIVYTSADSVSPKEIILPKSEISSIRFSNGVNMVFEKEKTLQVSSESGLYQRGMNDANRFYTGYKAAGTGTLISGLCFPVFALIPAIGCSSTVPSAVNLGIRNDSLGQNRDYLAGYTEQARKVKSKKVWKNYSIGAGIGMGCRVLYVLTILIALTSMN